MASDAEETAREVDVKEDPENEIGGERYEATYAGKPPPATGLAELEEDRDEKKGGRDKSREPEDQAVSKERSESEHHAARVGRSLLPHAPAPSDKDYRKAEKDYPHAEGKEPRPGLLQRPHIDAHRFPDNENRYD